MKSEEDCEVMIVIRGKVVMEGLSACSCYVRTSYAMSILLSD